jgi:DNA invertase Pin-like site-specific DNA recombinase
MKIIAYIRVSTKRQARSGLGLEAQQQAIAAYQKAHNATLLAEYVETESGRNSARPQLIAAIRHCRGTGARLVIAKLDRLSRNVRFLATIMDSGLDFVACDNPHATRLSLHIYAAIAEDEARVISERTRAALAAAKRRGIKLGTRRPGHRIAFKRGAERGTIVAKQVREQRRADWLPYIAAKIEPIRDESLSEIARQLNDAGCVTVNGKPFVPMTVKRLLTILPSVLAVIPAVR